MFTCLFVMVVFSTVKSLESMVIYNDTTSSSTLPSSSSLLSLLSTSTQSANLNYNNQSLSGEKIIFPDALIKTNIKIRSSTTHNCLYNICEEVDDYPEDYIKDIIRNTPLLHDFFDGPVDIANRINYDTSDDEGLCQSVKKTVYPKKALNRDNIEKIIVNDNENRQGIITEQCKEKECRYDNLFTKIGYKAGCEQKFTVRRLMALNDTDVAWDSFDMPSCCVCIVKKIKEA